MFDKEKRHYVRKDLYGKGTVFCNMPQIFADFELQDISAIGMQIITNIELNVEDIVNIELILSKYLNEHNFHLEGKIIHKSKNKKEYIYGVKFINLKTHDKVQLDELIKHKF